MVTARDIVGVATAVLLLVGHPAGASPYSLDESEECVTLSGASGVCRLLRECAPALDALRRNAPLPGRCGFLGWEEVVCCPRLSPWDPQRPQPRPRPRPQPRPQPQPRPRPHITTAKPRVTTPSRRPAPVTDAPRSLPVPAGGKARQACQRYRETEEHRIGWFILGGEEVEVGEFPHMVALGYQRQGQNKISWRCGGTLLSDRYVLTAAHCLTERSLGLPKMVRVGEIDLRPAAGGPGDFAVERAFLHPRYKRKFNYDDVGLVRLAAPVAFSSTARPACLPAPPPAPALPLKDMQMFATGWGAIDAIGTVSSPILLKTNLTLVQLQECRQLHRASSRIPQGISDDMICAGDPRGIADTCVGDSGGPLQVQEDDRSAVYTVVGITSFGPDPCGGRKPGVYVNVAKYVPWIESIVWGD